MPNHRNPLNFYSRYAGWKLATRRISGQSVNRMSRPVALDQALPLEVCHHAVDVDGRLSGDFRNLLLREGIVEGLVGNVGVAPDSRFAEQMGHPRGGIAPPAIHQPFVADRLVALRQPPEELLDVGVAVDDPVEVGGAFRPSLRWDVIAWMP